MHVKVAGIEQEEHAADAIITLSQTRSAGVIRLTAISTGGGTGMAKKLNEYMAGREDGLLMALDIVKKGGVEALEKEIRFRNVTGIRTALAKKDLDKATVKIKEQLLDTVTVLSVATLHDEYDFGAKRCERFIERFNRKAECLVDDMASWDDYIQSIREELGLELVIRKNE